MLISEPANRSLTMSKWKGTDLLGFVAPLAVISGLAIYATIALISPGVTPVGALEYCVALGTMVLAAATLFATFENRSEIWKDRRIRAFKDQLEELYERIIAAKTEIIDKMVSERVLETLRTKRYLASREVRIKVEAYLARYTERMAAASEYEREKSRMGMPADEQAAHEKKEKDLLQKLTESEEAWDKSGRDMLDQMEKEYELMRNEFQKLLGLIE